MASGWRLQTEHTQPCARVIRIVNEVNSSAHLTSLQLSLVQCNGTLCCYIMQNDWLQLLHQSTRDMQDWYFFLFFCQPDVVPWAIWPGGHQKQGNAMDDNMLKYMKSKICHVKVKTQQRIRAEKICSCINLSTKLLDQRVNTVEAAWRREVVWRGTAAAAS